MGDRYLPISWTSGFYWMETIKIINYFGNDTKLSLYAKFIPNVV